VLALLYFIFRETTFLPRRLVRDRAKTPAGSSVPVRLHHRALLQFMAIFVPWSRSLKPCGC
jgi:hypothetical protein